MNTTSKKNTPPNTRLVKTVIFTHIPKISDSENARFALNTTIYEYREDEPSSETGSQVKQYHTRTA